MPLDKQRFPKLVGFKQPMIVRHALFRVSNFEA